MILLSAIVQTFEADFLAQYQEKLLPSQLNALNAMSYLFNHKKVKPVM